MTARKAVWPMFVLSFVFVAACEEKNAAPEQAAAAAAAAAAEAKPGTEAAAAAGAAKGVEAAAPAPVKEVVLPSPQDVCNQLIEAAKAKDEAKVLVLSTPATQTAFAAEGVKDHVMGTLAAASCGVAKVDGDNAVVPLGATEPAQEATFSKAADGWKFDGAAFVAKYPVKVVKEKAKKAAAKVQHKVKGHDKKHR